MILKGTGRPQGGGYLDQYGKRVPSVTTITGARKANVEGLLVWANRMGREGKDHREVRDAAAGAGALAHQMVENAIHEKLPLDGIDVAATDPQMLEQATMGFVAYEDWQRVMGVEFVATETPMVCETYRYGGTPDAIGRLKDGKLALLDWKSGSGVYGDYLIQMAAYRHLWDTQHEERIESIYILRFGKEFGDFHFHSYPREIIDMGWEAFLHLRKLYELDKKLAKVAT